MKGRVTIGQALLRFLGCMVIAWLFMYLVPMGWFITYYIPFSFFLLMGTVVFGVCGQGWPFAAPGGFLWKPGMNRLIPGFTMMALLIIVAILLALFEENVWPAMPLFPTGLWFGIIIFMVTLWYTFNGVGPFPFKKPWANFSFAFLLILGITGVIWALCVNLVGTPFEGASFDPKGQFQAEWWFGFCIWIIVWIQVFGSPMCFQGWPFYKLGKPLYQIVLTIVAIVLGYACWQGSLAMGLSPTFSFGAIAASMIGWTLMHSVAFELFPFAKFKQPKRGVFLFILEEIVLTAIWILLLRVILSPMVPQLEATGLAGFDINALSAFFTLHATAIVLLVHHFFFMRAPLSIPGPPLGPDEVPQT